MAESKIFIDGLFFEKPKEGTPDFVKGKLSIQVKRLQDFMVAQKEHITEAGYLNIDLLKSKEGKLYLALNTYKKPEAEKAPEIAESDIPF